MSAYLGVILDLDGTLVDSFGPITTSLNAARRDAGLPPLDESVVRRHVGHGLEALVADLVSADSVTRGVRVFRETYAEVFLEGTRALVGAPETVRALAERGVRLAVASNKPARFAGPILEALGFGGSVRAVLGPDEETPTKPDPAMLSAARAALGLERERCVYVGDMPLDVESARRAGMAHLLVPTGSWRARELLEVPGARVIPQLSCLLSFTAVDSRSNCSV